MRRASTLLAYVLHETACHAPFSSCLSAGRSAFLLTQFENAAFASLEAAARAPDGLLAVSLAEQKRFT